MNFTSCTSGLSAVSYFLFVDFVESESLTFRSCDFAGFKTTCTFLVYLKWGY